MSGTYILRIFLLISEGVFTEAIIYLCICLAEPGTESCPGRK